jgi:hypothetical protein
VKCAPAYSSKTRKTGWRVIAQNLQALNPGAVAFIHRFGSSLIKLSMLALR